MQPSAIDPVPQAEKQNHCVTCPRGPRKGACTQGIEGPGTNASYKEKRKGERQGKIIITSHK